MTPTLYFRNAAAAIAHAPAGYIRLEWQPAPATAEELRAIYEHVLRAMVRYRAPRLLSIHNDRPPLPLEVQTWLAADWHPRAVAQAGYERYASVEAASPVSRLAARAVGSSLDGQLDYRYFASEAEAAAWLVARTAG